MSTSSPYEKSIVSEECIQLASQLGFAAYPKSDAVKPYLRHISYSCKSKQSLLHFYALLAKVVAQFQKDVNPNKTLKEYIEEQQSCDSEPYYQHEKGTENRKSEVTETFFLCLGLWTMMKSNFVSPNGGLACPIGLAYSVHTGRRGTISHAELDVSLNTFIGKSALIPPSNGELDKEYKDLADALKASPDPNMQFPADVESLRISAKDLNLSKLFTLAGVQVHWTDNLSRHLLLSVRSNIWSVEIFAFPCVLQEDGYRAKIQAAGVDNHYLQEIRSSYANLFNPTVPAIPHRVFNLVLKPICWCVYCSSSRILRRELVTLKKKNSGIFYDKVIEGVSSELAKQWNHSSYQHLWPRILLLQMHLQNAKPWSFWVLFRDRREKLPFWTFL